jgi:hypothetical protein
MGGFPAENPKAEKNAEEFDNEISAPSVKASLSQCKIDELLAYLAYYIEPKERMILSRLITFFRKAILPHERLNKMGAYNLSVVMGPCIFRPRKYSISDLINSPRIAILFFNLIQNPEKLE